MTSGKNGNCKDCKYFYHYGYSPLGEPVHLCQKLSDNNDVKNNEAYIDVYVHDDSGLETSLKVSPIFGCILFKQNYGDPFPH